METKIFKKIDEELMKKLFDNPKEVYIKYYDRKKENYFEILVRHGDDENPNVLLQNAISNLTKEVGL